jgi:hypothetical protein
VLTAPLRAPAVTEQVADEPVLLASASAPAREPLARRADDCDDDDDDDDRLLERLVGASSPKSALPQPVAAPTATAMRTTTCAPCLVCARR